MKKIRLSLALTLLAMTAISAVAQASEDRRPPREKWTYTTLQATVEAVDLETREVTLMGPDGELVTVTAGDAVERLDEFAVGDVVVAEYWIYLQAEFRDPTPEEKEVPMVIIAEGDKAPEGMDPAGALGAVVKAVVTIEVINRPDMLVTVKGPGGNYVSIPTEDPDLINKLHVGEVLVLTYAEALALSLEKAN